MTIEQIVITYLNEKLNVPVKAEVPKEQPQTFVLVEKTSGSETNLIRNATIAIQSYSDSLYKASELNETVKSAMDEITEENSISKCSLNADYNFTDTSTKSYRYQAVYDLTYYL